MPGTTETVINDSAINAYAGSMASSTASAGLHALTVSVSVTEGVTVATGQAYMGTLVNRVGRGNYLTYTSLANDLVNRRELSSRSAYGLMNKPFVVSSFPADLVDWCTHKPVTTTGANNSNLTVDTLSPIALVIPTTTVAVEYTVTVYAEWRVQFASPALSSTAIKRPPTPQGVWDTILKIGGETAGHIGDILGTANATAADLAAAGSMVGPMLSAVRTVGPVLGKLGI